MTGRLRDTETNVEETFELYRIELNVSQCLLHILQVKYGEK